MTSVGNVEISIRLAKQQLNGDITALQTQLNQVAQPVNINVNSAPAVTAVQSVNASAVALETTLAGVSAAGVVAISALTQSAKQLALAFDSARAKAATITEDASGLAASLRQTTKELDNQVTSTELLDESYNVLSAGFTKTADVTDILKNSTNAAVGGFSNVATVSGAVTTILNSYGQSADKAAKVTDVLVATQNAGKLVVAQYAGLIGQASATAAAAGVSFEEFSAFVATATAKGVQASSAVSGIRAAISAILSPSDHAAKLAQELGIQFDAAALKTKGLAGIMAELNAKGAATPAVLTNLFGSVEALSALMPSAGGNVEAFNKNLAQIQNSSGAAEAAAKKVSDSFENQLKRASNEASEALVSLGQGLLQSAAPATAALAGLLKAFNSLPEPVKQTIGEAIGLGGALAAITSALAAANIVIPIAEAGFTKLAAASGLATAATEAQTLVSGVAAAATGILTTEINLQSVALVADAAKTEVAAAAKALYSAATGGAATSALLFAGNLAKLGVQAALVAGAIYAVSEAFNRSEGAKFAEQVDNDTQKIIEFKANLGKVSTSLNETVDASKNAASGFDNVAKAFSDSGPIEAARVGLGELDKAAGGSSNTVSAYGEAWGIVTAKQRGAQLASLALSEELGEIGKEVVTSQDIIAKYGLTVVDAGAKQRLGAEGIKKFKNEAAGQIQILDQSIDKLKAQKAPTEAQQQLILGNIKNLQDQKAVLRERVLALDSDSNAMQKNSKIAKELLIDIDALSKAYQEDINKVGLKTEKEKAAILGQQQKGNIDQDTSDSKLNESERKGLEERLKVTQEYAPRLQAAKVGAKPEEVDKINAQIQENEKQSAQIRSQISLNLIEQKKKDNEKAVNDEKLVADNSSKAIVNAEKDKTLKVLQARQAGKINVKESESEIAVISQDRINSEIKGEESRLTRFKALRASNAITAKQFSQEEAAITTNLKKLKVEAAEAGFKVTETNLQKELAAFQENEASKRSIQEKNASTQTIAVRKQQLSGNIDNDTAATKINEIQKQTIKNSIALDQDDLKNTDTLEKQKLLTKENAAKQRQDIESRLYKSSIELVDKEVQIREQANTKIIADFERVIKRREALISSERNTSVANIKSSQLNGQIDSDDASKATSVVEAKATDKRIDSAKQELAKTDQLERNKTLTTQQAATRRDEIDQKLQGLQQTRLDQQLQASDRANKNELALQDLANKKIEDAAKNSANRQIAEIKRKVESGVELQEVGASEEAKIATQSTVQDIQQLELQLSQLKDRSARKVITARDAAKQRQEIEQKLADKNTELFTRQTEEAQRLKDVQVHAIQDKADAARRAFDAEIQQLEKEKDARGNLLKLLEQDKNILDSRAKLSDAQSAIGTANASGEVGKFDRALSAKQQLDSSKDLGAYTTAALKSQLSRSGVGGDSESQILAKRIQSEEKLAALQEDARKKQQAAARLQLEIELQRNRLTAETAKLEAEIAATKATSAREQAQANLEKAKISGDTRAIATAQSEVKSTVLQEAAANKLVGLADRGISMLDEYESNSRAALNAQGAAADATAKATEGDRRDKSALTLAQAKDKDAKAGVAVSTYDPISESSNVRAGTTGEDDAATQMNNVRSQYPATSITGDTLSAGTKFPSSNNNGLADLTNIANQIRSHGKTNNSTGIKDGVTSSGADIGAKLDKLGEQLKALASRPTTLTVTTANPVSDAADIYGKLSKNAVANSGL